MSANFRNAGPAKTRTAGIPNRNRYERLAGSGGHGTVDQVVARVARTPCAILRIPIVQVIRRVTQEVIYALLETDFIALLNLDEGPAGYGWNRYATVNPHVQFHRTASAPIEVDQKEKTRLERIAGVCRLDRKLLPDIHRRRAEGGANACCRVNQNFTSRAGIAGIHGRCDGVGQEERFR